MGLMLHTLTVSARADSDRSDLQFREGLRDVELNVGFANNLQIPPNPTRSDVRFVSLSLRYGWFETRRWEISVEAPLLLSTRPETHGGVGVNAMARRYFATNRKLAPFVEIGGGILFTNLRAREIAGDFQFTPQGGLGFRVRSGSRSDVVAALRFHHISNGGLRRPNVGLNSLFFTIGIARIL